MYPGYSAAGIKRTRIANAAGSRMLGTLQTVTSDADPVIGAVPISLGVSELQVAGIEAYARVRAEEVRDRLAYYAWRSVPRVNGS